MNPGNFKELFPAALFVILGAMGTYLLLPHKLTLLRQRVAKPAGLALAALATLALAATWRPPGPFLMSVFFYLFGLSAVACGILMVTSRDPVHSALWFAAVVLSTSGLFLQAGAQFLAAGTVIVYAGAIIVTFLFVIMLAQQEGQASYDRSSRAPARGVLTCFMLAFGLIYAVLASRGAITVAGTRNSLDLSLASRVEKGVREGTVSPDALVVISKAVSPTASTAAAEARPAEGSSATGVPPRHVAGLGAALFIDNLFAAEAAGALLFVGLAGAIAIAAPRPPKRPQTSAQAAVSS